MNVWMTPLHSSGSCWYTGWSLTAFWTSFYCHWTLLPCAGYLPIEVVSDTVQVIPGVRRLYVASIIPGVFPVLNFKTVYGAQYYERSIETECFWPQNSSGNCSMHCNDIQLEGYFAIIYNVDRNVTHFYFLNTS